MPVISSATTLPAPAGPTSAPGTTEADENGGGGDDGGGDDGTSSSTGASSPSKGSPGWISVVAGVASAVLAGGLLAYVAVWWRGRSGGHRETEPPVYATMNPSYALGRGATIVGSAKPASLLGVDRGGYVSGHQLPTAPGVYTVPVLADADADDYIDVESTQAAAGPAEAAKSVVVQRTDGGYAVAQSTGGNNGGSSVYAIAKSTDDSGDGSTYAVVAVTLDDDEEETVA